MPITADVLFKKNKLINLIQLDKITAIQKNTVTKMKRFDSIGDIFKKFVANIKKLLLRYLSEFVRIFRKGSKAARVKTSQIPLNIIKIKAKYILFLFLDEVNFHNLPRIK